MLATKSFRIQKFWCHPSGRTIRVVRGGHYIHRIRVVDHIGETKVGQACTALVIDENVRLVMDNNDQRKGLI